ncbi:MAG: L-seryl-tRNA(Sec) selenium transferase [Synergistaceae bacterium]|nr:L-seryl-tRNA(Sec) selenium transferase [Synergistaceae bacterium]
MNEDIKRKMKLIPGMDTLLEKEWTAPWQERLGRDTVKQIFGEELARIRNVFLAGEDADLSPENLRVTLEALLEAQTRRRVRPVLNATGVVVHTNLGRSILAEEAVEAAREAAANYSDLEYNLNDGTRGRRGGNGEADICVLTGAESALLVNNNAGAVLLCLSALARGTEVIVSRGELVEIGGSFRVPEIMEFSGAELVEAGATNITRLRDYERAVTEKTSMLLKVHPSNFRIEGFTAKPDRRELANLARERGLIFMEDAGSGLLVKPTDSGIWEGETDVRTCIEEGADIVTFSGDKILGGPQIGVVAGKKTLVDRLRGHPVMRALRVDKMTLAAFEGTMRLYRKKDYDAIPTLAMLRRTQESMKTQASRLAEKLSEAASGAKFSVVPVPDAVGGGSCPALPLPGWGVAVTDHPLGGAGRLQALLRSRELPIICGARDDALVIHVRTLRPGDEAEVVRAFAEPGA